ncbi:hypothetical protein [Arthrobacter sp. R-11]|uniref:hypothetical protein n=1 Tax=Arthrobacter sp. R-11 TaxID=3404053 RepID=UPI003CF9F01B
MKTIAAGQAAELVEMDPIESAFASSSRALSGDKLPVVSSMTFPLLFVFSATILGKYFPIRQVLSIVPGPVWMDWTALGNLQEIRR